MLIRPLILFVAMALLVGALPVQAAEPPSHRHSVAVVIGNMAYQGRIPEVSYAHRDADAMKAYLVQVLGYREGNIIDLRDATKAELEAAFGNAYSHEGKVWRFMRPGRSHVTVFYFGHGVPGLKDKRGYILPVNADPNTPEINGYPVDLLYKNLAALGAESVTVYLDACFSGESDHGMLFRSASPVFVQASAPKAEAGMTVLTAASAEQVASWDEENRHGLFTWHLLQALQGEADKRPFGNGDGQVTVAETRAYLDEEMTYVARRRFGRVQNASVQGTGDALLGVVPDAPIAAPAPAELPQTAALTPSFAVEELDQAMVVTGSRVNVRAGPGTEFDKVESFAAGAEVEVTGKVEGKNWYRVALADGGSGYVFGKLLSEALPAQAAPAVGSVADGPRPGMAFYDCATCPEMVVVPAGSFRMGSPSYEENRDDDEGPVHSVSIPRALAVGKYEVTRAEYATFVAATGRASGPTCWVIEEGEWEDRPGRTWQDPGFRQTDRDPVVCVSWDDAQAYAGWLSRQTGKAYRLPSEAEWEYVARAGATTARHWGDDPAESCGHANAADRTAQQTFTEWTIADCTDGHTRTAPVGGYAPNAFGLHDTLGNVWEWTSDCWNEDYGGAPSDGASWTAGDCAKRVRRGGSWYHGPRYVRTANRSRMEPETRSVIAGFRLVRELD